MKLLIVWSVHISEKIISGIWPQIMHNNLFLLLQQLLIHASPQQEPFSCIHLNQVIFFPFN